jgi:hypothetical protein
MERLREKVFNKQQDTSSFTLVLRTLLKQKEEIANKYKHENHELHKLLIKQQNLLNKLNEDNMNLNRSNNELKESFVNSNTNKKKSSVNSSSSVIVTSSCSSCCNSNNQFLNENEYIKQTYL